MGLFGISTSDWLDPLDLKGKGGQKAALDAANIQAASAERGLAELRRQFDTSQGNIQPFMNAGISQLPFLQQGASVEGLDEILGQIMNTDMFGELVDERRLGVEGMLSAGGLSRSGSAIEEGARIPTDLAMQISDILNGRASNLATVGANTSVGAGSQSAQFGANSANLMGQSGNALASGVLGEQQAVAGGQQNALALAGMLAKMFGSSSDPRLKENVKQIGQIGPLPLYKWDWKYPETITAQYPDIGFMSTDVKEHYPKYVGEFGGFETVYYQELIEVLDGITDS